MEIPRIRPEEVQDRAARGEVVLFLDSRSPKALETASEQISGSLRVPADDVDRHLPPEAARGATLVSYCT
jgi:hypothetical protein